MRLYITMIKAIDPVDDELKEWAGPLIPANSEKEAQHWCDTNGLGYCTVVGEHAGSFPWPDPCPHWIEWEWDLCWN